MFTRKIFKISLFAIVILISFVLIFLASCKVTTPEKLIESTSIDPEEVIEEKIEEDKEDAMESDFIFADAVRTPHLVSSVPADSSILPGIPVNMIISFNLDLYDGSKIIIEKDGTQYNSGDAAIDKNGLTLRVGMDPGSPDGLYEVKYTACWPDGSCHDGSFEFAVDSDLSGDFTDLRGNSEVTVDMENISFDMPKIIISSGTTVTWINKDDVGHTVNSDPHPGHNFYPEQNSSLLSNGETFSLTFDMPGFYPYHCSPHYSTMKGAILVE